MAEQAAPTVHKRFNFADSDITVCSSDNIIFCVHKANLCAFSVVFKDMFMVGHDAGDTTAEPIAVAERAQVLQVLLAMCYPAADPPLDLGKLASTLIIDCYEATVKYQMWVAGLALRSFAIPIVHKDPFPIARLAHKLNDSVLLGKAAQEILKYDLLARSREYSKKAGPVWPTLLEYHYRCRAEVVDLLFTVSGDTAKTCHFTGPGHAVLMQEWRNACKKHLGGAAVLDTTALLAFIQKILGGHPSNCGNPHCREAIQCWDTRKNTLTNFKRKAKFDA